MAEVIGVSEAQLRFVTNTQNGMGLMKCGNVVIPFDNQIEKGTDLYNLFNTNIHEKMPQRKAKMRLTLADSHVRLQVMKSLSAFAAIERSYPSRLCGQQKFKGHLCLWNYHRTAPGIAIQKRKFKPEPNSSGIFLFCSRKALRELRKQEKCQMIN